MIKVYYLWRYFLIVMLLAHTTVLLGAAQFVNKAVPAVTQVLSYRDAAAFALLVYHDAATKIVKVPAGFKLLCGCPRELQHKNYYGEAYYRIEFASHNPQQPSGITVVIAHRGTILASVANLVDDLLIALKQVPEAFAISARLFTDYVDQQLAAKLASLGLDATAGIIPKIIHVGHSLGAIHAELSYVYQRAHSVAKIYAISFESPGSKEIMLRLSRQHILPIAALDWAAAINIINADVNAINACNSQVATVQAISPGYNIIYLPKLNLSPLDLKFFSIFFTYDQHSMTKIYRYFNEGGVVTYRANYPSGFLAAFHYYRTYQPYGNKQHSYYWNDALHRYWQLHSELQRHYHNNEQQYLADMITYYLF